MKRRRLVSLLALSISERRGKKITVIEGLSRIFDLTKILRYLKKSLNCNGGIKDQRGVAEIHLSGDYR